MITITTFVRQAPPKEEEMESALDELEIHLSVNAVQASTDAEKLAASIIVTAIEKTARDITKL